MFGVFFYSLYLCIVLNVDIRLNRKNLSLKVRIINIKHNKVFFLHWSKELRIKNTTRKRLPEKVVVFAFIVFNPFVTQNKYVYLSSQFLITINLKEESMENNKPANNEIQIELSEEMAQGTYANLAIISHSSSEFILDFIRVVPGAPKAQVKSRVILTPDNAQRLLFALQDNIKKFGEQLQAGNNNNKTANFEDFAGPTGEA